MARSTCFQASSRTASKRDPSGASVFYLQEIRMYSFSSRNPMQLIDDASLFVVVVVVVVVPCKQNNYF